MTTEAPSVYNAYIDDPKFGRAWYASLNGELWLGLSRQCGPDEFDDLAQLFEGDNNFQPMRLHRSFLEDMGATFLA